MTRVSPEGSAAASAEMSGERARKLVHVAMGGFAFLLRFLSWPQALLLAAVAVLNNLYVLPLYARKKIFRGEARERGRDLGIVLYPLSIAILILIFRRRLEIVAATWGLLAFGDGLATIVGRSVGGPRLFWNRAKTWSGYAAFVLFGGLGAILLYGWTCGGRPLLDGFPGPCGAGSAGQAIARIDTSGASAESRDEAANRVGGGSPTDTETRAGARGKAAVSDTKSRDIAVGGTGFFDGLLGCTPLLAMLVATTILAATVESLPIGIDDNILVPIVSSGFLYGLTLFSPEVWGTQRDWVVSNLPWAIGVNLLLAGAAYAARSVGMSGVVAGTALGAALFAFGGWRGFLMLVVFFVLGTVTTKMGYAKKAALGIAQEKGGRRGAKNAIANCGMGAFLAYLAATTPFSGLMILGLVAAFATAACDTVSSEIGQAYGRTPYLITTLRRVPAGTDGAVSIEGTLAGIAGAAVVAAVAAGVGLVSIGGGAIVVLAAVFGSTLESVMGATWERSKLIDNEAINFANTLAGALFAIAVARFV